MPIFGKPTGEFIWPSEETYNSWNLNYEVFISGIRFKQGDALKGIQFCLSNGNESPLYETAEAKNLPL